MSKSHRALAVKQAAQEAVWFATRDGVQEAAPEALPTDADFAFADVEPGPDAEVADHDGRRYAGLFRGTPAAPRELQKERPIHRLAACLCAAGMSFREIGNRLNVSPQSVSNWFRQPWFQQFVDEEIRAAGLDPLKNLLSGAAKDSVMTLIELRDDREVAASVRAKCASDLLDRAYGKAPTTVVHTHDTMRVSTELAAIDREINELIKGPEYLAESNTRS
jgi:hypothetical protein